MQDFPKRFQNGGSSKLIVHLIIYYFRHQGKSQTKDLADLIFKLMHYPKLIIMNLGPEIINDIMLHIIVQAMIRM